MTRDQEKLFRLTGICPVSKPAGIFNACSTIVPPVDDNINHLRVTPQLDPNQFNGLTLSDVSHYAALKVSDDLHRPDVLARDFKRGTDLLKYSKDVTPDKFLSNYFKK